MKLGTLLTAWWQQKPSIPAWRQAPLTKLHHHWAHGDSGDSYKKPRSFGAMKQWNSATHWFIVAHPISSSQSSHCTTSPTVNEHWSHRLVSGHLCSSSSALCRGNMRSSRGCHSSKRASFRWLTFCRHVMCNFVSHSCLQDSRPYRNRIVCVLFL